MKFLLISDTHLLWDTPCARLDDAHKTVMEKFRYVLNWAKENEAVIVHAADFFERPRSWYLLPEVVGLLRKYAVPVHAVFGQHDQYMYSKTTRHATSLGLLNRIGLVDTLEEPYRYAEPNAEGGTWVLWGASHGGAIPQPSEGDDYNILAIHAPIAENPLFPNHSYMDAQGFLEEHNRFDVIICGDIHRKFDLESSDGRRILNTGPMIRKEAVEYNFTHTPGFYVLDTDKGAKSILWESIPCEEGDVVLSRDHIVSAEESVSVLSEFIQLVSTEFEAGVSFVDNLKAFIEKNNIPQEIVDIISEKMEKGEDNG